MSAITVVFGCYEHCLFGYEVEAAAEGSEDPLELKQVFSYAPHLGVVKSVASSGKMLVSGGADEVINIYDLKKLKEVGKLQNHGGSITVVAFTGENNTHMISGSADGMMCLWQIKDWNCLQTIHVHNGGVISLALHPSSRLALSVGTDNQLKIWNLLTGKLATSLPLAHTPSQVLFNPSGSLFSVVFPDAKQILVHKLDGSLLRTLEYPHKILTSVFLNDHLIAAAGEEGSIGVWDTGKGFQYAINLFSEQQADREKEGDEERKGVAITIDGEEKKGVAIPRIKTISVLPKLNHLLKDAKETLPYVIIGCSNGLVVILSLSDGINGSILATVETQARLTCLTVTTVTKTSASKSKKRKQSDLKTDDLEGESSDGENEVIATPKIAKENSAKVPKVTKTITNPNPNPNSKSNSNPKPKPNPKKDDKITKSNNKITNDAKSAKTSQKNKDNTSKNNNKNTGDSKTKKGNAPKNITKTAKTIKK